MPQVNQFEEIVPELWTAWARGRPCGVQEKFLSYDSLLEFD